MCFSVSGNTLFLLSALPSTPLRVVCLQNFDAVPKNETIPKPFGVAYRISNNNLLFYSPIKTISK